MFSTLGIQSISTLKKVDNSLLPRKGKSDFWLHKEEENDGEKGSDVLNIL